MQQTEFLEDGKLRQLQEVFQGETIEECTEAMDKRFKELQKEGHELVRREEISHRTFNRVGCGKYYAKRQRRKNKGKK